MKHIKEILFGVRAQGQPVLPPKFKTTMLKNQPTFDKWVKEFKVSNRYGHRGSFYHNY